MDHPIYRVVNFDIVGPHTLQIHFDDGMARTICFQSILEGEMFGLLRDQSLFNQVSIDPKSTPWFGQWG